jgi:glycosyltransferase involved in cell wall biosynthesis
VKLLIITNLYPLPWEPTRAAFNRQQFDMLAKSNDVTLLVPVAWRDYFRNRRRLQAESNDNLVYTCFLYTPGFFHKLFGWFMLVSIFAQVFALVRRNKIELILASWVHPEGFAASVIARLLKVPYAIKVHGSDVNLIAQDPYRKKQIVTACSQAKFILSVSSDLKEKLYEFGVEKEKIHVVYNGVNSELFKPQEKGVAAPILLYVGNLKVSKGVLDLLEAFKELKKIRGNVRLSIVGGGPDQSLLKNAMARLDVSDSVEFLGVQNHDEVAKLISSANLLVLPSHAEGVPNVLLEAASCGTPCVATNVGGIPEVVVERKTGLVVEVGNVDAICNALDEALAIDWRVDEMVAHSQKFSWERNVEQVNHLLNS